MGDRTDAEVARDRCLQAMLSSDDGETRRSLWNAARKYAGRMRAEATGENTSALARTHKVGLTGRAIVK